MKAFAVGFEIYHSCNKCVSINISLKVKFNKYLGKFLKHFHFFLM